MTAPPAEETQRAPTIRGNIETHNRRDREQPPASGKRTCSISFSRPQLPSVAAIYQTPDSETYLKGAKNYKFPCPITLQECNYNYVTATRTTERRDKDQFPLPRDDYVAFIRLSVGFEYRDNEDEQIQRLGMGSLLSAVLGQLFMETPQGQPLPTYGE